MVIILDSGAQSDAGGWANEDTVIADRERAIFIVADGLGGRPGGALASRTAAAAVHAGLSAEPAERRVCDDVLRSAAGAAHAAVRAAAAADAALEGMGAALCAAAIHRGHCAIVHVGDCRAYQIRAGAIERLTRDHTLVAELVARNHLSPEKARSHPMRHVLSRAVGSTQELEPDLLHLDLGAGDGLLLVTDGVTRALDDGRILEIVEARVARGAEAACRGLVKVAVAERPADNVSAILVLARDDSGEEE